MFGEDGGACDAFDAAFDAIELKDRFRDGGKFAAFATALDAVELLELETI